MSSIVRRDNARTMKKSKWDISLDELAINYECKLGTGAFANVYKGQLVVSSRSHYAQDVAVKLAKDRTSDSR